MRSHGPAPQKQRNTSRLGTMRRKSQLGRRNTNSGLWFCLICRLVPRPMPWPVFGPPWKKLGSVFGYRYGIGTGGRGQHVRAVFSSSGTKSARIWPMKTFRTDTLKAHDEDKRLKNRKRLGLFQIQNGGGRSIVRTRLRIASNVGTRREMPSSSQRSGSSAFPKPQSESMRRSTSATLRLLFDPALPQRRRTN